MFVRASFARGKVLQCNEICRRPSTESSGQMARLWKNVEILAAAGGGTFERGNPTATLAFSMEFVAWRAGLWTAGRLKRYRLPSVGRLQGDFAMIRLRFSETRRGQFLATFAVLAALAFCSTRAHGDDLPKNTNPRAISGDSAEPECEQRVSINVGPKKADIAGDTDRVIQAAVDYVARKGGGTVRVLPGTYKLRNSIFLQSKVRLLGSGQDSVLFKEPSVTTKLIVDGDHWDQEVTLADTKGFQVGDGVRPVAKDPHGKGTNIVQRTLVASSGNRFKLDLRLVERFHLDNDTRIATNV